MTDWLDVEEVRADVAAWQGPLPLHRAALHVLKAIAALPEPDANCRVEAHADTAGGPLVIKSVDVNPMLHRIWLVAREITGGST